MITTANGDPAADAITLTGSGFTLTADLPAITQPLTITGPGSGAFTLNAAGFDAFIFSSGSTTGKISGVSITQAGTTLSDYAIDSQDVAVTLDDVAVDHSRGGLRAFGGSVTVTNSKFNENTEYGVFVALDAAPGATFTNVDFSSNDGAGLDAELTGDAELTVSDSMSDTSEDDDGFHIDASDDSSVTITDTRAKGNDDSGFHLIATGNASLTLTTTLADLNDYRGVNLDIAESATAALTDTTVTNTANDDGIHVEATDSAVVSFTDTTSTDDGDDGIGADLRGDARLSLTRSTVIGAGEDGVDFLATDQAKATVDTIDVTGSHYNGLEFNANWDASIELSHATVTNSGDIGARLWAYDAGRIDIATSTISGSDNQGVLISSDDNDASDALVTLTDTTVRDNGDDGVDGAGIRIGQPSGLTISLTRCTVSGNTADNGGGLYVETGDHGDGGDNGPLDLTILNSTISGNSGATVGGLYVAGSQGDDGTSISILNSTITANTVREGGPAGVGLDGGFTSVIHNSIIAGNIDLPATFGDIDYLGATTATIDYSLVQTPSPTTGTYLAAGTGNLTGVDPKLGPLADNGGPTLTHLLLDGSPAINAGDPAFTGLTADQRGLTRVVGVLDMGAVETQPALAVTGADAAVPLAGGVLLLGVGGLLLLARRRRSAR